MGVLRQGFEFLPPRAREQGVNVFWRIDLGPELNPGSFTAVKRLSRLVPGDAPRQRQAGPFLQAAADVVDYGLPYLERYCTVEKLLAATDRRELDESAAFGPDVGGQRYRRGLCLHHVGRVSEGIDALRAVLDEHSLHPYQLLAIRMRDEGNPHAAEQAEADFAKVVASGRSWPQKDRAEAARALIAEWSEARD